MIVNEECACQLLPDEGRELSDFYMKGTVKIPPEVREQFFAMSSKPEPEDDSSRFIQANNR